MMKHIVIILSFISICFVGCKKDEPISSNGSPIFYFNGTVNGSSVSLQAGVDSYYMYSSYIQDSNNVYNFFANLKQNNCSNCANQIKIQINDYKISALNASAKIDSSLMAGNYSFLFLDSLQQGTPSKYLVNFTSIPSTYDSASTYLWDFGDGSTSVFPNPSHIYSQAGNYTVCLKIDYVNSCSSSICNQVKVGIPEALYYAIISDTVISTNTISFSAIGNGTPISYLWDFGDGSTATGNSVSHTFLIDSVYKVCLDITNSNSIVAGVCANVPTPLNNNCYANFYYVSNPIPNPFSLSNILITWVDNNGIVYNSKNIVQPNDSYFKIISVENYLNNENNESTKKLHVQFKCLVSNGSNAIEINNADAVIAVSYK